MLGEQPVAVGVAPGEESSDRVAASPRPPIVKSPVPEIAFAGVTSRPVGSFFEWRSGKRPALNANKR